MNYEHFYDDLKLSEPEISWKEKLFLNYRQYKKRKKLHRFIAFTLCMLALCNLLTLLSASTKNSSNREMDLIAQNIFLYSE